MVYIPNEGDNDAGMRYEGLVCYAFDCGRMGDPEERADAGVFDANFIEEITEEGVAIMNYLLDKLITKHPEKADEFEELKNSINQNLVQQNSIELIDLIIKIIKE